MQSGRYISIAVGIVVSIASSVPGCGGNDDGTVQETSTFERIQTQVFDVSCSSDSCHGSLGQAGSMILDAEHSWDALINQQPANPIAASHGWMRVMPGQSDQSFLMAKVTHTLGAGEGLGMPYNSAPLEEGTIDVIKAWIDAGAPKSGRVPGDDGRDLGASGDPSDIHLQPPAHGVQLAITAREVPVGKEETTCHYFKMPSEVDFDVNRIQIAVTGGSHHIHLYRPYDSTMDLPDGEVNCDMAVDFDVWELVVATQLRKTDWEMPAGVAYHFRAGEQLLMQTHFVNVGSLETQGQGKVLMNLNAADDGTVEQYAGALFGQDRDVHVLPFSSPTKAAECVFPNPITIFAMTGHYHFRGRRFDSYRWDNGTRGANIYHYEGYNDPLFMTYDPLTAPFFDAGQGFQWECYWENPSDRDFKFGPFTDTNEHCNVFAFYYPTQTQNEAITCVTKDGVSTTKVRAGD
jgi:hypothetical protein